jgi:unsaturated rhamnogalacturonyl hydrolase
MAGNVARVAQNARRNFGRRESFHAPVFLRQNWRAELTCATVAAFHLIQFMKNLVTQSFCLLALTAILSTPACRAVDTTNAAAPAKFNGATPLEWSKRMADSETARKGDKHAWKEGGSAKWDYTVGLFTLSLLKLNESVPNARQVAFVTNTIGSFISDEGSIHGYKPEEFQLDALNPGKTVLALFNLTHEERYKKCASMLRKQLDTQPRTSDGGFWHKQRYTEQMWLDGLFMGAPFYAECAQLFKTPKDFDDVAKQFRLIDQHLYDAKSGLFFHGWDSKKVQDWANKDTGCSSNFWGRAVGWYVMGIVDTLDFLPADHPDRAWLIAHLKKTADGIVKWQDADTGLWWQVMDAGKREGNYLEATCATMFVYSLAKGANHGYLGKEFTPAILKGYNGIVTKLIKNDGEKISLTQCCSVAGLGASPSNGYKRDGSFVYYVHEPIVENDLKGVGPFILAGIEIQKLSSAAAVTK